MRIGFIGAGAVGAALAQALSAAGYNIASISSRSPDRAGRLARRLPDCRAEADPQAVVDVADLVFLTVPDDAIAEVCAELKWTSGKTAIHCSGALTREALSTAAAMGARTGSFHPMQTFSSDDEPKDRLFGVMFGVEATDQLRATLEEMSRHVGGWPLALNSEDKIRYHLAGVFASNYLTTLADLAADMLHSLGPSRDDALRGLLPLIHGSVENLASDGPERGLTGPIARGDAGTIERHLDTLAASDPHTLQLYVQLGLRTLTLAERGGGLDRKEGERLAEMLRQAAISAGDQIGNGGMECRNV
jgi:predicted short-subunit dehydrogenase-like oxidoreductase (DUF2520 family)